MPQPIPGKGCEGCPFKGSPKRVGFKGPVDSPFVIVGEGPGIHELTKGLPFVGPSGKMLDEVLERAGFNTLGIEPYVTNATQCYPGKQKNEDSMNCATLACGGRLHEELVAYPRKVILTLGSAAMRSVLGNMNMKVTRDRGKVYQSNLASCGVVVAVHPAYVMRNGTTFGPWASDVALAVSRMRGEVPELWTDPTWEEVGTRDQLEALCEQVEAEVKDGDVITGDFETDSLDSLSGRILELGITWGSGDHVYIITEECFYENPDLMKRLIERKGPLWNWHNGKFDIRWAWRIGAMARVDEDTMLMSYALNENGGFHDLDQVANTWLEAPDHKGMLKPYLPNKKTSYRAIPPTLRREYAAKDVKKTHRLHPVLHEQVENDRHLKKLYYGLLIPACTPLCEVEDYGVLVNLEQVEKNKQTLEWELWLLDACLDFFARQNGMGGMNFGSWQQLQTLLYNRMKLGPIGSSTDEGHLIKYQRQSNHPIFDVLMKRREIAKRGGTYVNNIPKFIHPDGRIHSTLSLHKTTTGRLAGSDPNLLNQPRVPEIRAQYVAGEGKVFVEVDLNQAELRSLTIMSNDPILLDIYTKNETSVHDTTTAQIYGSKKELAEDDEKRWLACKQLLLNTTSDPEYVYKEAKMRGKAVNFGIVYGREAHSLAEEFNIPASEAQRWLDTWYNTYKGAFKFIKHCRTAPIEQRTQITVFGRKKRWGCVSYDNLKGLQNEAANFPHQSTASDVMLKTFIEVQPVLRDKWDAHIWLELYDAIYYEIDDDPVKIAESVRYVQEVIPRVARDAGLTRIPFIGDAKVGKSWGKMKDYTPPPAPQESEDATHH